MKAILLCYFPGVLKRERLLQLLLVLGFLGACWQSYGETLVLCPEEDDYHGFSHTQATSQWIRYSKDPGRIFVGQMGPGHHGRARGFLNFDLSPLAKVAGGQPIQINSVTLALYKIAGPAIETALDLRLLGDGTKAYQLENHGDDIENWQQAPLEEGGKLGELLIEAANPLKIETSISFENSLAFITAAKAALDGDKVLRLMVLWSGDLPQSTPPGERITRFEGSGAVDPERRPTLTIDYTLAR